MQLLRAELGWRVGYNCEIKKISSRSKGNKLACNAGQVD